MPHSTAEAGESSQRDPVKGRGHRQMDPLEGQMANTPRLDPVSTKRQRIAELARDAPEMVFTSLAHHIDMHVLRAAYAAPERGWLTTSTCMCFVRHTQQRGRTGR